MDSEFLRPSRDGMPLDYARLRRGTGVDVAAWSGSFVEQRIMLRAEAVEHAAKHPPIFGYSTGGAFHSLPLLGVASTSVHTVEPSENPQKSHLDVIRHHVPLDDGDVVAIGGHLVTSLERTVYDAIRTLSLDGAVALMDAAIRSVAWDPIARSFSGDAGEELRAAVFARVHAHRGARGIRQARFVTDFADGRAESPGESQSRLRMWQVHVPAPLLQMPIQLDTGERRADFAWPELRRFGEFDGAVKTIDPLMTRGRTADQVLEDQRDRRAAIEAATGWRVLHWGSREAKDPDAFLAMLTAQGWPSYARV